MIFGQYFTPIGSSIAVKDVFDLIPKTYKRLKIYKRLSFLMAIITVITAMGLFQFNNSVKTNTADMKVNLADLSAQYDALYPIELEYNDTNNQISALKNEKNNQF